MHWMRIDRYYTSSPKAKNNPTLFDPNADENLSDAEQQFAKWIDDVQAVSQPMLCQMCEAAPCENVCPVNATSHDDGRLERDDLQPLHRHALLLEQLPLQGPPVQLFRLQQAPNQRAQRAVLSDAAHAQDGRQMGFVDWFKAPEASGMREEDEWDLIKMVKNPDVTVRMRGVMEKCTYCIQRIQHAEIAQKVKAGGDGQCSLERIGRHDSENRVPAGVSGGRDCVRRHQRPGQHGDKMEGAAAQLFRARRIADEAAHDVSGARPQSESRDAGLSRALQHGRI